MLCCIQASGCQMFFFGNFLPFLPATKPLVTASRHNICKGKMYITLCSFAGGNISK